jgi:hypothetical protein
MWLARNWNLSRLQKWCSSTKPLYHCQCHSRVDNTSELIAMEIPDSNLGTESGSSDWLLLLFSSIPSQIPGYYFKLDWSFTDQTVTDILQRKRVFDPGGLGKGHWERLASEYFSLYLSIWFYQFWYFIHLTHALCKSQQFAVSLNPY